ncbi:MAG: SDR family NAD(P)-dependent oxidoreductase [Rhodospirillaceae bacterium]|nr:SDR family NAD(P)-dependent oxidoreductase [Rhodospirillaceae bacterium]
MLTDFAIATAMLARDDFVADWAPHERYRELRASFCSAARKLLPLTPSADCKRLSSPDSLCGQEARQGCPSARSTTPHSEQLIGVAASLNLHHALAGVVEKIMSVLSNGDRGVVLIIGAGVATGSAIARRFAREGFTIVGSRRDRTGELNTLADQIAKMGGTAHVFPSDARKEEAVIDLVDKVESEIGPITACVHNIGANVKFDLTKTTARVFYKVWEMAAFSAFLVGREVANKMIPRGHGTIIFTGATASVRGNPGFAAFSSAMHAKRAVAQSMARELGPRGIHISHTIIDGPIDTPWTREQMQHLLADRQWNDNMLAPDHIAEMYWQIHNQPRSAWTFEMDMRPWAERW